MLHFKLPDVTGHLTILEFCSDSGCTGIYLVWTYSAGHQVILAYEQRRFEANAQKMLMFSPRCKNISILWGSWIIQRTVQTFLHAPVATHDISNRNQLFVTGIVSRIPQLCSDMKINFPIKSSHGCSLFYEAWWPGTLVFFLFFPLSSLCTLVSE